MEFIDSHRWWTVLMLFSHSNPSSCGKSSAAKMPHHFETLKIAERSFRINLLMPEPRTGNRKPGRRKDFPGNCIDWNDVDDGDRQLTWKADFVSNHVSAQKTFFLFSTKIENFSSSLSHLSIDFFYLFPHQIRSLYTHLSHNHIPSLTHTLYVFASFACTQSHTLSVCVSLSVSLSLPLWVPPYVSVHTHTHTHT